MNQIWINEQTKSMQITRSRSNNSNSIFVSLIITGGGTCIFILIFICTFAFTDQDSILRLLLWINNLEREKEKKNKQKHTPHRTRTFAIEMILFKILLMIFSLFTSIWKFALLRLILYKHGKLTRKISKHFFFFENEWKSIKSHLYGLHFFSLSVINT